MFNQMQPTCSEPFNGSHEKPISSGNKDYCSSGVEKNNDKSFKRTLKIARQSNAKAQFKLAEIYILGIGIDRNNSKAVKWYKRSAKNLYPLAQIEMGWMRLTGEGIKQNYNLAIRWLKKVASNNYDINIKQHLVKLASTSGG